MIPLGNVIGSVDFSSKDHAGNNFPGAMLKECSEPLVVRRFLMLRECRELGTQNSAVGEVVVSLIFRNKNGAW